MLGCNTWLPVERRRFAYSTGGTYLVICPSLKTSSVCLPVLRGSGLCVPHRVRRFSLRRVGSSAASPDSRSTEGSIAAAEPCLAASTIALPAEKPDEAAVSSSSPSVPPATSGASLASCPFAGRTEEPPAKGVPQSDGPSLQLEDRSVDVADGSSAYSEDFEGVSSASEDEEALVEAQVRSSLLLRCLRDLLGVHFASGVGVPSAPVAEGSKAQRNGAETLLRQERILALLLRRVQEREDQGIPDLLLSQGTSRTLKEQLVQVLLAEVLTDISVRQLQSDRTQQGSRQFGSPAGNKTNFPPGASKRTLPSGPSHPSASSTGGSAPVGTGGGGVSSWGEPTPLAILQRLVATQRAQAAHAEDQADATAVAAGRSALASLAQQFPRLAPLVSPLSAQLAALPRLFHLRLQLLQQQAQRAGAEETAEAVYQRLTSLVREYESLARMPFGFGVPPAGLSVSGGGLRAPQGSVANRLGGGLASGQFPEVLGSGGVSGAGDSLSSYLPNPLVSPPGTQGQYGTMVKGGLAGHAATHASAHPSLPGGGKEDTGGSGTNGAMPPPQAPAPKKPSRKGMGMSGWALFAKEKRAELQQSGQLEGDTLPEQTSFVARFWHQLSKEAKAEWGRRAEELNRQAGLRMKKEEEKKQQQRQQQLQGGGSVEGGFFRWWSHERLWRYQWCGEWNARFRWLCQRSPRCMCSPAATRRRHGFLARWGGADSRRGNLKRAATGAARRHERRSRATRAELGLVRSSARFKRRHGRGVLGRCNGRQ